MRNSGGGRRAAVLLLGALCAQLVTAQTRSLGNWYSARTELRIGSLYAAQIDLSAPLVHDPLVTGYMDRLGQRLVEASGCKLSFSIKIIEAGEINAMALPGGFLYVDSGLILAADNEAELAGVMAHEIAHDCAHHVMRQMTRTNLAQLGLLPAFLLGGGWAGYGAQLAIPTSFLGFSRAFESEADQLGLAAMSRAGYDPNAYLAYFERIASMRANHPGLVAQAFAAHPPTDERLARLRRQLDHGLSGPVGTRLTTPEFVAVKLRLAELHSAPPTIGEK